MKKEIEKIELGYKIARDITSVMNSPDKVTPITEVPNLQQWIAEDVRSETLLNKLKSPEELRSMCNRYNANEQQKQSEKLLESLNVRKHRKLRIRKIRIGIIGAAAAIISLSLLIYNPLTHRNKTRQNSTLQSVNNMKTTKIEKIEMPTILYDNGEEIEVKKGEDIAIDGSTIAKSEETHLSYKDMPSDKAVISTIIIPHKQKFTVILEDGTEITIGANSKLRYPSKFGAERREVELEGEAFFKVTKDNKPFIVKIHGIEVKVYGTEFNINAYTSMIKTTLLSGSVGISYKSENKMREVKIEPKECFSIDTKSGKHNLEGGVNIEKYRAWLDGYFRCDEEPLSNLLETVSNWYDVDFKYSSDALKTITINALLSTEFSIERLLKMVEMSSGVRFIKEEGGIYIVK